MKPTDHHTSAVIRVGEGRGFVMEVVDRQIGQLTMGHKLIVTAAHCLPSFPEPYPAYSRWEKTYKNLLGAIGAELTICAELLFADPISDIAVLWCPDDQSLYDQAEAYWDFTDSITPLQMADAKLGSQAWLLSLEGKWRACKIANERGPLMIADAKDGIHGGMSGSPVLDGRGNAVGVVSVSGGHPDEVHTSGGPNPRLVHHLPAWLVRALEH